MNTFTEWRIKSALNKDSEFYFTENFIGIRNQNEMFKLPGNTIYTVIENDEQSNIVTLQNNEGEIFKFDQNELAKAMAESTLTGFQTLQYPVGYMLSGNATDLAKLSIYDSRLKGKKLGEGPKHKMVNA